MPTSNTQLIWMEMQAEMAAEAAAQPRPSSDTSGDEGDNPPLPSTEPANLDANSDAGSDNEYLGLVKLFTEESDSDGDNTPSPPGSQVSDHLAQLFAAAQFNPDETSSAPGSSRPTTPDGSILGTVFSPSRGIPAFPGPPPDRPLPPLPGKMASQPVNELLSTQKSSDGLQVALHPLPILEISDHITRAHQRGHKGAIVGALLGQQNGRQITIEYSFTVGAVKGADGCYHTDPESFIARLDQMRDVHKNPPMDLVGWYTFVPRTGPIDHHIPIHTEILERYNESAILLGFHVQDLVTPLPGNPLPITIYESVYEAEDAGKPTQSKGEDLEMKDTDAPPKMTLRFRELPYGTETGDAEMIAMQHIREGVAHATRSDDSKKTTTADKKGKGKATATSSVSQPGPSNAPTDEDANLNKDELEQISALETKQNAIKMMRKRIHLLIAYLKELDPAFLNATKEKPYDPKAPHTGLKPSQNILRQIQALVTNIELVTPAKQDKLEEEILQETNDVKLVGLMKDMFSTISDMRDAGKKFAVAESSKSQKNRQAAGNRDFAEYGGSGGGGGGQQGSMGGVGDLHLL